MAKTGLPGLVLIAAACLGLTACGESGDSAGAASSEPPSQPLPGNSVPIISGTPSTIVTVGAAYSFQPIVFDPDDDTLVFSVKGLPIWASFNALNGLLSGTPSQSDLGASASILIIVSDGQDSASLEPFQITVVPPSPPANAAPTISGAPPASVQATMAYSFTPLASDPDGQALTFSIANKPSWAFFSTSTGRLSGTPTASHVRTYSNIVITASDGSLSASLPAFSITVTAAPNTAPTISGTPASTVVAGNTYSFTPSASDADGDTLAFSISGKPGWATFSSATGRLSGTPTTDQAGSYLNIVISVSDGQASRSLAAFGITVTQPPAASGTATLSWTEPTQNTDGSTLTDLAGYRVYHGASANTLDEMTQLPGAGTTTHVFSQLASGTHYFAVSAYTTGGAESALSAVGSKTIP